MPKKQKVFCVNGITDIANNKFTQANKVEVGKASVGVIFKSVGVYSDDKKGNYH